MLNSSWIRAAAMLTAGIAVWGLPTPAAASEMDMSMPMSMPAAVTSSVHRYAVPPIALVDQHGRKVRLDQALAGDKPALVQFFFTSCTTICDVRSAQLVAAVPKLRQANIDIGLYTITIDPDRDTSERLLAFSRHFGVPPPNWYLLTGSVAKIKQTQAAFDASDPSADKMMHEPLTFIRGGKNQPWQRIDGLTTTGELVRQIKIAVAAAR